MFYVNQNLMRLHVVKILKYYGTHIWMLLLNDMKACTGNDKIKSLLKYGKGQRTCIPYVVL